MASSPLQIVNRAITEIAQGAPLISGDPTTNFDGTANGIYAATLYPGAVQMLLRNGDWEFCRRNLILIPSGGAAPMGWTREYQYPPDCLRVRQVVPALPIADVFDPQPIRWDVGDFAVSGIISVSFLGFGGAGYAHNDTGTITGTFGTPATYIVDTVDGGGAVLTYTLTSDGSGFTTGVFLAAAGGGQPGIGTGFNIGVSAVTFTGARVIWTNQVNASLIYSTAFVTEAEFDSIFTEQLVRYLGSMLAMPIAGRPDFSREMLNAAGRIGQAGVDRDS